MQNYYKLLSLFILLDIAKGSILLWGPKETQFPALQEFNNNSLDDLLKRVPDMKVVAFESEAMETAKSINEFLSESDKTTAYIPNSNVNFDNLKVSELTGNKSIDIVTIQSILDESKIKDHRNSLVALVIKDANSKTQSKSFSTPVLYSATTLTNENIETMIFSSKPLLLETNLTSFSLGEPILIKTDIRETLTRLIAWIPVEDGKVILRFKFSWLNNYWHFVTVEVQFVNGDDVGDYTLIPDQDIKAPRHNSYRCSGETSFSDEENGIKITFFDLQAQPDVLRHHQFGKACDCLENNGELRIKRKVEDETTSTSSAPPSTTELPYVEPTGDFVIYNASLPTNKDVGAMLYSSSSPLLKINSTTSINLGDATVSKVDVRDTYTRLIATIPVENGKITLRFKFPWQNGYWSLTSVEVQFITGQDTKKYNLTINQDVKAPRHFSYHCGGHISFVDPENEVELYLFEVQAQPDAVRHRFSDAYNCVPFTTGPLLSGLFVTFILLLGLLVGLVALDNIKTMDKFDNHKSKQLNITVNE